MATVSIRALTDLWNDGGTTYNAIKMNVTNSASAAGSKLLNLQVGGTEKFTVDKNGNVVAAGSITGTGASLPSANDGGALGASGTAWSDLFLASGGVINWNAGDVTLTHSANALAFGGASGGYSFDAAVKPSADDAAALGTATVSWADLFLASGGVINFANGDVTITHSANALAIAGASSGYSFDAVVKPSANDGAALGSGTVAWADLFLASGAVVNFNNGDVTLTHSADALAFAGAASGYSFDAAVSISNAAAGALLNVTSTDAGATAGPLINLLRNSASPAAADIVGGVSLTGKDSGGNTETYVRLQGVIDDPTNASEDGRLSIGTIVAGTLADRVHVGAGIYTEGVTGGDKGAGSLNVDSFYIGNSQIAAPADQTAMEAAASTTAPVTPAVQHNHPGHPKCWAWVSQSGGTPTLSTSYNITSITDTATGRLTITIGTDFSSANWAPLFSPVDGSRDDLFGVVFSKAAGSVVLACYDTDDGTALDPSTGWSFVGFGDHA